MVKTKRSGIHVQFHPEGRSLIGPLTAKTKVCGMNNTAAPLLLP
jgi:hypothetical protein